MGVSRPGHPGPIVRRSAPPCPLCRAGAGPTSARMVMVTGCMSFHWHVGSMAGIPGRSSLFMVLNNEYIYLFTILNINGLQSILFSLDDVPVQSICSYGRRVGIGMGVGMNTGLVWSLFIKFNKKRTFYAIK